jgi:hypothetical protein
MVGHDAQRIETDSVVEQNQRAIRCAEKFLRILPTASVWLKFHSEGQVYPGEKKYPLDPQSIIHLLSEVAPGAALPKLLTGHDLILSDEMPIASGHQGLGEALCGGRQAVRLNSPSSQNLCL